VAGPEHHQHYSDQDQAFAQRKADSENLAKFGYKQELNRALGFFSNFAIAFSFISATNGFYALFWYGLDVGGPAALVWSWPIVVFGQLMVALTFAEAASHYPLAGGVYQWAKHLVNGSYGWFAAWMFAFAVLIAVAGVAIGASPIVCSLAGWSGTSQQLFWIAFAFIVGSMVLNIYGVKITAFFNNIGTVTEIIGLVVIAIALYAAVISGHGQHQGGGVLLATAGTAVNHSWGYSGAFLAAMLTSAWVLFGFDAAGGLAEETADPTRTVPRAIVSAVAITAIVSMFWLVAMVLAIPDLAKTRAQGTNAIAFIFDAHFPHWVTSLFLLIVLTAIFVCCLAIQAAGTRLLYAFGRDRMVPGSRFFAYVNPRTRTPLGSALTSGVAPIAILIFTNQLSRVIAWATTCTYIVYQMVVLGAMIARTRGWPHRKAYFNLGKWGWPVNIAGFAYGVFMIVNLSWPRNPGEPWYSNYLVPFCAGVILALGAIVFAIQRARGINVGRTIRDIEPCVVDSSAPGGACEEPPSAVVTMTAEGASDRPRAGGPDL
jgi:amino acid transporter